MICCHFSFYTSWIAQYTATTLACIGEHHSCLLAQTLSTSPFLFLATTAKVVAFSDIAASTLSLIHPSFRAFQPFMLLSLDTVFSFNKVLAYSNILFFISWEASIMSMWLTLCNSWFLMNQIAFKVIIILNEFSSFSFLFLFVTTPKKLSGLTMNWTITSLVEISMESDLNPSQLANQSALATLHLKNWWQQFSIFSPHNTQLGSPSPILSTIFSFVGRAFCPILHK